MGWRTNKREKRGVLEALLRRKLEIPPTYSSAFYLPPPIIPLVFLSLSPSARRQGRDVWWASPFHSSPPSGNFYTTPFGFRVAFREDGAKILELLTASITHRFSPPCSSRKARMRCESSISRCKPAKFCGCLLLERSKTHSGHGSCLTWPAS